jgi:hypothetical protein
VNIMSFSWSEIDSYLGNFSSPMLTAYRPGPICRSIESAVVLKLDNFQFFSDSAESPKRVDICVNRCINCFALYMNPCYSDFGFSTLFAEAGQSYGSSESRHHEVISWLKNRGLLEDGMAVMDIGCYDGCFLAEMPKSLRKTGIDISEQAIKKAQELFGEEGIQFILGNFENFQYNDYVNTITMFHVLEHLRRLIEVLSKLRSIANIDTRLAVEVPIIERGDTNDINGFFLNYSYDSLQSLELRKLPGLSRLAYC